ncbi:hypothetical protein PGQ11_009667 [Apiospora arundinis]|uniref:Uncharacterized protein n=1 Tax=Apiospora arundinis TaxID=335852 RepID=A0ABR2IIL9_9PEZI
MWQPAIEGRSRRVIRIHHKLVKSRQQLTQALKKRMREGEDFYFEMRNDFYIIQVLSVVKLIFTSRELVSLSARG